MPDRQSLVEAGTVTLTETEGSATAMVTLITPGQGSSGIYSAEVLEAAAEQGVFAAGTHMYLDHPAAGERPERSLDRLAGVLAEDATWNGEALQAPAKIYPRYRSMLAEMQNDIGVSIRAGGVVESGVVQSIGPVASVDYVTKPGRGGSFQLVESAVLSEGHGMTANDLSTAVSDAVRSTYGGADGTYTWVRDYTDEWVVFQVETPEDCDLYQQTYTVTDGVATLTGKPVEVVQVTTYQPAPPEPGEPAGADGPMTESESTPIHDAVASTQTPAAPAGAAATTPVPAPITEGTQEVPMSELTEAEVQQLREAADALPTVTAERDEARAEAAALRRREAARPLIAAGLAEADLPARTTLRLTESLLAALPTSTDGNLDEAALATAITDQVTATREELAEAGINPSTGTVHGLGAGTTGTVEESAEYEAIYGKGA